MHMPRDFGKATLAMQTDRVSLSMEPPSCWATSMGTAAPIFAAGEQQASFVLCQVAVRLALQYSQSTIFRMRLVGARLTITMARYGSPISMETAVPIFAAGEQQE